jgi:hypothetical protein
LGYVKFISLLLALGACGMMWRSTARHSLAGVVIWASAAMVFLGLAAAPTLVWIANPWATH